DLPIREKRTTMTSATDPPDDLTGASSIDPGNSPVDPRDSPIDRSVLDTLVDEVGDGDVTILDDLIDSYLAEATDQVPQRESAATAGDAATVAALAPSLKSSSAALGASNLADLLKRTELHARAESPEYPHFVKPIRQEYTRVSEALRTLRHDR